MNNLTFFLILAALPSFVSSLNPAKQRENSWDLTDTTIDADASFCNTVNASPKSTRLKKYHFLLYCKSPGSRIFHTYGYVGISILVAIFLVRCLKNAKSTVF